MSKKIKKSPKKGKKSAKKEFTAEEIAEISTQIREEIAFARKHKSGKVANWNLNEKMYYGEKVTGVEARANVDLGQMSAFVHTILSKIDSPLSFKFRKRKESQLKRVEMLNALKQQDQQDDDWDIKDVAGKKQGVIYGRAIFSYFANSIDGEYQSHLENVDVYNFLIDPAGGGIDLEKARYMGNYGVVKSKQELIDGIKDRGYIKTSVDALTTNSADGNATERTREENQKDNRTRANGTVIHKDIPGGNDFKFWNWVTTYKGERIYCLFSETSNTVVELSALEDKFESNLWPFWTWAAFPDLTEFWTPSFCDYVREIFMAMAVSINQMLDNAEQINKPQRIVDSSAFDDMSQLKYRREGTIEANPGTDLSKAFRIVETQSITTPIEVFKLLDSIQEKASGVTAASKGSAENGSNEKATIYKGNEENSADRFGFLNRSYSFGYKRFAKLWEAGVRENLIQKTAVDMLGPNGVEVMEVSRRDIFRKNEKFGLLVEASNAETALSENDKRTKLNFLNEASKNQAMAAGMNPKKAFEISASIVGFTPDEIKDLQDTSNFGDASIMSEAMRDIELVIDGEDVTPNQNANTSYLQRIVDYSRENQEHLTDDQFNDLMAYVDKIRPIVTRNMVKQGNGIIAKQMMDNALSPDPANPILPPTDAQRLPTPTQ